MGVKRGAWEEIRRGEVWRPGMLHTHVPALSMSDALRWRARAAAGSPKAAWTAAAGDALKGIANIGIKMMGVYDQQVRAYKDAVKAKADYEDAVKKGAKYDPKTMRDLDNAVIGAKNTMESWKTKFGMRDAVNGVSAEEAAHSFLAGKDIPDKVAVHVNSAMGTALAGPAPKEAPGRFNPPARKYDFTVPQKAAADDEGAEMKMAAGSWEPPED